VDLRLRIEDRDQQERSVPPVSLQLLLENAVKHNEFSLTAPLCVHVEMDSGAVVVWNAKRPLRRWPPTSKLGLANLDERCRLILGQPIEVRDEPGRFLVRLPLGPRRVETEAQPPPQQPMPAAPSIRG
jgi:LytS/YehU family sensor histidine kinase